ncbi:MAG TPA: tetratricopeptide repeat protein [Blastocatellia bacterium]|nr:tetratricopeptide repeat protein [Blastocatellia bacterium]
MHKYKIPVIGFISLILFLSTQAALAQSVAPAPTAEEADALFKAQKWPDVAKAYGAITKNEPKNGRAWYRLGYAFHSMGNFEQAAWSYQRAVEIAGNPMAMYNLACSYARLKDKDKAFEWLNKSITSGFFASKQLQTDADLVNLRDDARFKESVALADRTTRPCEFASEYKQFDFWVGEWNVETTQGQPAGKNIIERMEQGCVLMENWTGAAGGTGKSINFYNASTGKWRQTWVDSTGNVAEYEGEYKDGAMRFDGNPVTTNGKKTLRRLTLSSQGPDRVRQLFEQSADDGKTWTPQYDLIYVRKK